ncbi:hypothetical protein ACCUM_4229 [Candidatus Accumulibacter phosphatis]|uniref:Uncharacterized protein n=1 Tax=Candidatus Accumulibacter phosphatis TaxID=327160 RepID=A0A5S4EML9_9PROT|nr:hypothetical protein ACCUM_4229 [Candidatus Accumulibacter phosphatis]
MKRDSARRVEAGAARVGMRRRLGSACRFQHGAAKSSLEW